jgi:hypothetical protein
MMELPDGDPSGLVRKIEALPPAEPRLCGLRLARRGWGRRGW